MKYILLLLLPFIFNFNGYSQKNNAELQRMLQSAIIGFNGEAAVFVKDLKTGKTASIHADSLYPTASMVKVPILIGIMDKLNNGQLQFHQEIVYNDSLLYPGVDILGSFKDSQKIEVSKLIMLMMTMSDNTASRWLQMLAGTGVRINYILDSLGFANTRVNSRTPGREAEYARYGWGQTTPREMATLFERIYKGDILSPSVSYRMLKFMNRNYWDAEALSQIPPYATVFSKNGALDEYRSETVLVRGISSEYLFCIITNHNADKSWTNNNEAWTLIRKVSALLWKYFEPRHPWSPPPMSEKFY
jgi:beta-lactamase class A